MNKHLQSLVKYGLLSFGREKAVHDLLKHITNAEMEEKGDKTIITLRKGGRKLVISVNKSVKTTGDSKAFEKELEILEKDCLNEYSISVRSKKELLMNYSTGRFFKFILVPVILEVYNNFNLNLNKFCELLNNTPAEQKILFFKMKRNVKAECKNNTLIVSLEKTKFSVKLQHSKPNPKLLLKNFDVGNYQNNNRDAFFSGLPFILKILNGDDFEYSFEGESEELRQICRVALEALYKYLMIENV